jgi:uncharacterized coiled-coil DUF342 family protein
MIELENLRQQRRELQTKVRSISDQIRAIESTLIKVGDVVKSRIDRQNYKVVTVYERHPYLDVQRIKKDGSLSSRVRHLHDGWDVVKVNHPEQE